MFPRDPCPFFPPLRPCCSCLPVGLVHLSSVCLLVPLVLLCCSRPLVLLLSAPLSSLGFACFLAVSVVCLSSLSVFCLPAGSLCPALLLSPPPSCCCPLPSPSLVCLLAVPPSLVLAFLFGLVRCPSLSVPCRVARAVRCASLPLLQSVFGPRDFQSILTRAGLPCLP